MTTPGFSPHSKSKFLGDNLLHLRIAKGISRRRFCRVYKLTTGNLISIGQYAHYEYGNNEPPYPILFNIAKFHNLTVEQLFYTKIPHK